MDREKGVKGVGRGGGEKQEWDRGSRRERKWEERECGDRHGKRNWERKRERRDERGRNGTEVGGERERKTNGKRECGDGQGKRNI